MAARRIDNTPDDQALKVVSKALVKAVGGVEAAEGFCRSSFRRLSEYGVSDNDCFMPVDVVRDLEAVAHGTVGFPQVTRFLARQAGGVFVPLPRAASCSAGDLHAAVARHSRKAGDVTGEMIEGLGDGVVEPAEAARAMPKIMDAVEELMSLHATLTQIAENA
jgi:hypothetical protein